VRDHLMKRRTTAPYQCKQWQRRCRALVQCCEPVVEWRVRGGRGRGKEAPLLGAALLLALAALQARCVLAGWPQAIERNLELDPRAAAAAHVVDDQALKLHVLLAVCGIETAARVQLVQQAAAIHQQANRRSSCRGHCSC